MKEGCLIYVFQQVIYLNHIGKRALQSENSLLQMQSKLPHCIQRAGELITGEYGQIITSIMTF